MLKFIKYGVLVVLTYFIICNIVIYLYALKKTESHADVLIVLGAQVVGNPAEASPSLQVRLDSAVNYLNDNTETKVIVCGGKGQDESATEASVMARYLLNKGIDLSRIYIEDKSLRTVEQIHNVLNILPPSKTVIATNDFHLLRSIMLAKRFGIEDVSGLSSHLSYDNVDRSLALIREPLALLNSWLFDHPNDPRPSQP